MVQSLTHAGAEEVSGARVTNCVDGPNWVVHEPHCQPGARSGSPQPYQTPRLCIGGKDVERTCNAQEETLL